jgi:hypothetical protein
LKRKTEKHVSTIVSLSSSYASSLLPLAPIAAAAVLSLSIPAAAVSIPFGAKTTVFLPKNRSINLCFFFIVFEKKITLENYHPVTAGMDGGDGGELAGV